FDIPPQHIGDILPVVETSGEISTIVVPEQTQTAPSQPPLSLPSTVTSTSPAQTPEHIVEGSSIPEHIVEGSSTEEQTFGGFSLSCILCILIVLIGIGIGIYYLYIKNKQP